MHPFPHIPIHEGHDNETNGTSAENRHILFVTVFLHLERRHFFFAANTLYWRPLLLPLNRPYYSHQVREDSPPLGWVDYPWRCTGPTSMVSRSVVPAATIPPQSSQLWAILAKQEEHIVKPTQEDDDEEVHELAGDDGMAMGPSPKILFDFELDDAHAWCQVPLAGPRTTSSNSISWGARTGRVNYFASSTC